MLPFKFTTEAPAYSASEVFYVRIDPGISDSKELLRSLYYLLWFPGYFGFNWDALCDCLKDLAWIPCRKVVIVHEALPNLNGEELAIYLDILKEASLSWGDTDVHELEVFFIGVNKSIVESIVGC